MAKSNRDSITCGTFVGLFLVFALVLIVVGKLGAGVNTATVIAVVAVALVFLLLCFGAFLNWRSNR